MKNLTKFLLKIKLVFLFVMLYVFVLGANPLQNTVAPMDLLLSYDGWKSVAQVDRVQHHQRSDVLDGNLPSWLYFKNSIRNKEFPLWKTTTSGGSLGILNFAEGALTPNFLAFILTKDNALGFYFSRILVLIISGIGMYFFLNLFFPRIYSIYGSIVFSLCGFHAGWFFWPQVTTSMWIPWIFWATYLYLQNKQNKYLPLITLTSVFLILGGHPSVAAYAFYALYLFILIYCFCFSKNIKSFVIQFTIPGLFILLAFFITAIPLLSLYDMLSQQDLSYRSISDTAKLTPLKIQDLFLFFKPYKFGLPEVEKSFYTGKLSIFLSAISLVAFLIRSIKKDHKFIAAYGLILFVVSVILAFGFIDTKLIRLIPVFSFNLWSRTVIITDFSLAILSTCGLFLSIHLLNKIKILPKIVITVFLSIIIIVQILDQKKFFNIFNVVTPNNWFLPITKSIEHIRNNINPLQSVIADNSFIISGTLGSYGIKEWFAHDFHPPAEKILLSKIVNNPFVTPTASIITGDRINFQSPLFDFLGIKYLLINKKSADLLFTKLLFGEINPNTGVAPPIPENIFIQNFYLPHGINVDGLAVLTATYQDNDFTSNVDLTIKNSRGNKVISVRALGSNIYNNKWTIFTFKQSTYLPSGNYSFSFLLNEQNSNLRFTMRTTDSTTNSGSYLNVNGIKTNTTGNFYFYSKNNADNAKWKSLTLENNITIFENTSVPRGGYFVSNISDPVIDYNLSQLIDTKFVSSSKILINSQINQKGWIVLPIRSFPGWRIYIDGKEVQADKIFDTLPAIHITKPSQIVYTYRPDYLYKYYWLSVAGGLLLIILTFKFMKPLNIIIDSSQRR